MAYAYRTARGQTYYLHTKTVTLQNGRRQRLYYFAPRVKAGEALDALPAGYAVRESEHTGVPHLHKV